MRECLFHLCALGILLIGLVSIGYDSCADLLLFNNGDYRYGKIAELPDNTVSLEVNGAIKYFTRKQIKGIHYGIDEPAAGEIVSASDFTQIGGTEILLVTGYITHRSEIKTLNGKSLTADVENGFDVPIIHLVPTRLSFYNRKGCFMSGILVNSTTQSFNALEMRMHLYDPKSRILGSKDFYIYRIPAATPERGPGQRKFEINFPDIPYDRVNFIRLVRKF